MISTALSIPNEAINFNCKMSSGKFKYFVSEFSKLNRREMIDPPEFPFALPVIYYGNYHLFMGASTLAPHYLDHMLKILGVHKEDFSNEDYRTILNKDIKLSHLNAFEKIFCIKKELNATTHLVRAIKLTSFD